MTVKKIASNVDNFTEVENKRRNLILQVQELYKNNISLREISRITGKDRRTLRKYLNGDPNLLCRSSQRGTLWKYADFIIKSIEDGLTATVIADQVKALGYEGTLSNIRQFVMNLAKKQALDLAKYNRAIRIHDENENKTPKVDYITRKGVFNYLWMNDQLTASHHDYLWEKYKCLQELEACIREFREIFSRKCMPLLYIFIERYKESSLAEIASFSKGLEKDINAVENAVASPLSNGFVEGTNSKVKTIKKTMYGRCGKLLLEAKLMYEKKAKY